MYMPTYMHMLSLIAYCRVNSVEVFGTGSSSSSHSGFTKETENTEEIQMCVIIIVFKFILQCI